MIASLMRRTRAVRLFSGLAGPALALCAAAAAAQTPPSGPPPRNDYTKPEAWLCRPDHLGACAVDLTSTVVAADGTLTTEAYRPAKDPKIDCFYVYPTVSNDPTPNSDMIAGDEETKVVLAQFARFGAKCRLFAPLYRQVTLTALRAAMTGKPMAADRALALNDVRDAWNDYLARDNHGRGVVLIGHSQGSGVLTALIKSDIDGRPVQDRIVSALLLGTSLPVPAGKDVGGAFASMPLCRSKTQTGCALAYASFRAESPPPANSRFGKAPAGMTAACVNPAAPGGGEAILHPYFVTGVKMNTDSGPSSPWLKSGAPVPNHFVQTPGWVSGECVNDANGSYLAIRLHNAPGDRRTDVLTGDVVVGGVVLKDWGLHLIDANLAMGDLLDLVDSQSKAWLAKH
jgi:hypothetical protein